MVSTIPYPPRVVGFPVMLEKAGVMVTAAPVEVTRPFASTVIGVIAVAELLTVPAVTPEFDRVTVMAPDPVPVASPDRTVCGTSEVVRVLYDGAPVPDVGPARTEFCGTESTRILLLKDTLDLYWVGYEGEVDT